MTTTTHRERISPGTRKITCRYLKPDNILCTGEVAATGGDVLLCTQHLAAAYTLVRDQIAATTRRPK